jgi:hypothetical protein
MNIPGFTAEASLCTTAGHYQWIWNQSGEAREQRVSPQQLDWPWSVRIRADRFLSYCWELRCFFEPHIGPICLWRNRCLGRPFLAANSSPQKIRQLP